LVGERVDHDALLNSALLVHCRNIVPELIAALKECAASLDDHIQWWAKENGVSPSEACPCLSTTLAKANQVLAKADQVRLL